jgi:hypothetical protein
MLGLATPGQRRVTHFCASTKDTGVRGDERPESVAGFVEEVRIDGLMGQVRLRIGDQILMAVVTTARDASLICGRRATRWRLSSRRRS